MKREVHPAVFGIVIALVVIAIGVVLYRRVAINPPSSHPQLHFGPGGKPAGQMPAATSGTTAP